MSKRTCIVWNAFVLITGFLYVVGGAESMASMMEIHFGIEHTEMLWISVLIIGPRLLIAFAYEYPEVLFLNEIDQRRVELVKEFWAVAKRAPEKNLGELEKWIIHNRNTW